MAMPAQTAAATAATPTSAPLVVVLEVREATAFHHPQYLKIFPPSTTKNCTLQRRPQRPRLRLYLLPSRLRSPAFFLPRNWWATRACNSIKTRPVLDLHPQDLWTLRRSFVRPLQLRRRLQPSVSLEIITIPLDRRRHRVIVLPRRRIPKTIRFLECKFQCHQFPE